jgi:hypothetical protein
MILEEDWRGGEREREREREMSVTEGLCVHGIYEWRKINRECTAQTKSSSDVPF